MAKLAIGAVVAGLLSMIGGMIWAYLHQQLTPFHWIYCGIGLFAIAICLLLLDLASKPTLRAQLQADREWAMTVINAVSSTPPLGQADIAKLLVALEAGNVPMTRDMLLKIGA